MTTTATGEGTSLFRALAEALGRRLCAEAIWHEDRCTWTGDEVFSAGGGPDPTVVHRPVGGDLYAGTSGIGWFLAHLWRAVGGDDVRKAAEGALRHALHRSGDLSDPGLFTGALGVALASVATGRLLASDDLTERGLELGDRWQAQHPPEASHEVDLLAGLAGRILALVALSRATGHERFLAAARSAAERLVAVADRGPEGWSWSGSSGDEPALCGLGHGASGIALALLELGAALRDDRLLEAAWHATRYERSWFSRDAGNWPDLREVTWAAVDAGRGPGYPVYWCHGAGGIGLARLRAYQVTGDDLALAEAAAAIDAATATMWRALARPRFQRNEPGGGAAPPVNLSLCHGLGSVLELHLVAAEVTGDDEHLEHARLLARKALGVEPPGSEVPPQAVADAVRKVPCGIPDGDEAPGLLLGLAGVGATLLRLSDTAACPSPALPNDWVC